MLSVEGDVWFTGDTHFGHERIIRYCNRPFRHAEEMDSYIIRRWNKKIDKESTVIHLGDVSFTSNKYLPYLNGDIHLIKGNHDNKSYNRLFHSVSNFLYLKIGRFVCFLRHNPVFPNDKRLLPEESSSEGYILHRADFVIHGHVHEKFLCAGKNINVGVDVWDFKPVHISELIAFMEKKDEQ